MEKLFLNILGFAAATILLGCKKELQKYDSKPAVYFAEAGKQITKLSEIPTDSTVMSFSLSKNQDSIVSMIINIIGPKQNTDRPYKLIINTASNAIAGTSYQILNSAFVIRKNQLSDTVKIKFFRRTEMLTKTFLLNFELQENEHFSTNMKTRLIESTKKNISMINYRLFINDITQKPLFWLDGYFGPFSRKKLFLMSEVLGVEPTKLATQLSIGEFNAYGRFVQRYLNEQRLAGKTIYEDDGSEMTMGPTVQ